MSLKSIFLLSLVNVVFGYPGGAPLEACDKMLPDHGATPQTTPAPYTVTFVRTGNNFDIEVSANSMTTPILGFIAQVRDADEARIGTFDIPTNDPYVFPLNCDGVAASAATFKKNNLPPIQSFNLKWVAPSTAFPVASFRLTVVTSKLVFWSGISVNLLS